MSGEPGVSAEPSVSGGPGVSGEPGPSGPSGPSVLEVRYRRLLRVLPAGYRAVREQEMVEAFVQTAVYANPELGDLTLRMGWPGARESLSVVRLALRLRWADPLAPERFRARTDGLRLATLACLAVLAVTAAMGLVDAVWFAVAPPPDLAVATAGDRLFGAHPDAWSVLQSWGFALWIPALAAAASGGRRGARLAAAFAAVPVAVTAGTTIGVWAVHSLDVDGLAVLAVQLATLAGLTAMSVARGATPPTWRRAWLLAAAAGFAASETLVVVARLLPGWPRSAVGHLLVYALGPWSQFWCLAAVVAALGLAVRHARGRPLGAAALIGSSSLAGAATLVLAGTLPLSITIAGQGGPYAGSILVSSAVQLGLTATITLVAGTLAAIRVRRMPPVTYQPTGVPATA